MGTLAKPAFDMLVSSIETSLDDAGHSVRERKPINYGVSLILEGGGMLNVYNGKKGPTVVAAGKMTEAEKLNLLDASRVPLEAAGGTVTAPVAQGTSNAKPPSNLMGHKKPWIGCDESGKGDYFGPLAVAAVLVKPAQVEELVKAGIRDSKDVGDTKALALSGWIEKHLPCAVRVLDPKDYNARYSGNLNVMLSDLHAECIGELAKKHGVTLAISDRFGNPARIEQGLRSAGLDVQLTSRPKAEADVAVAAASLLARGLFLEGLKRLGAEATLDLPPGAGPQVLAAGRRLVQMFGAKSLTSFAKLHFKTTKEIS